MEQFEKAIFLMNQEPIFLNTANKSTVIYLLCEAITLFVNNGEPDKAAICHQYIALAQSSNTSGKIQAARNFAIAALLHTHKNDKQTNYQHAIRIYEEIGGYDDTIIKLKNEC